MSLLETIRKLVKMEEGVQQNEYVTQLKGNLWVTTMEFNKLN